MASTDTNLSRRQALAGLSILGTVAIPGAQAATKAATVRPGRAAWDRAFAHWVPVETRFNALHDRFNAAEEAWGEAGDPRVGRYFDEYHLNMLMERGHIEGALAMHNTRQRVTGGDQIDVKQTADEFEAYRTRSTDLRKHFRVDEYWDHATVYRPTYYEARDRIMAVPAPDIPALLVKIEIAAVSLDNEHAESMLVDARRLLSDGRA